jgi:hypothetical protein
MGPVKLLLAQAGTNFIQALAAVACFGLLPLGSR